MNKKYSYYFIDLGETIYADCGDEAEAIYSASHKEEYKGDIELTVLATGETRMMYHIEIL